VIKDLEVQKIDIDQPEKIKVAIVQSTYHLELNENMVEYCKEVLMLNGLSEENISVHLAPGTWEVPLLARKAAKSGQYDAIVAFAIILQGDTYHFDMIANEVARSLMETSVEYLIPVGFEILAVNKREEAIERGSRNSFNKGIEAGNAILHTLNGLRGIE